MSDTETARPLPALLVAKRAEIAALCREYGVARLEVFGSVMTDEFDPARSDVDFLAAYLPGQELGWWTDRFYELEAKLADIVGHPVDVVSMRALDDPFFRFVANMTRIVLHDESTEAEVRTSA